MIIFPVTLPDELIHKILYLLCSLEVKSLMQLKCVCKSWNSLISDPIFINMHLIKSSQNITLKLFSSHFSKHTLFNHFPALRSLDKPSIALDYRSTLDYPSINNTSNMLVGCCNGLLCFLHVSVQTWRHQDFSLFFFNPATRSLSKKLGFFSLKEPRSWFKFSFGYDNLTSKYKVVAFCPTEVRVFTTGDNVWRNIQPFPVYPYSYPRNHVNGGVYLNNSLNWFALGNNIAHYNYHWEYITSEKFVIISLDLGKETYTQLMPPKGFYEVQLSMPTLCVLMNCLCFSYHLNGDNFVIWQMREFGVEDSWTKLLKFSYKDLFPCFRDFRHGPLLPLYIFENGDILIRASEDGYAIRYNTRDNRIVDETGLMTNKLYWFLAQHYVESLVPAC